MSECNHDCSNCQENCSSRQPNPQDFRVPLNPKSHVKKVIGIVSGKGGVGKSLITSMMAVQMNRLGHRVGIMDADITGPSIPKAFGIHEKVFSQDELIVPRRSKNNIQIVSTNLLLEEETAPVVWRGPIVANMVKQFWSDVFWDDVDYLFVDMPPGTGDVPLTVFQSLPVDGIIIVTSPQELVSMIVSKAVTMANMMKIPVLGIIENMSYMICPDCGHKLFPFGQSHTEEVAARYSLKVLAHCPIDPQISAKIDAGEAEEIETPWLLDASHSLESL
ncbi:MAG: Mrp/NBP35 family ATP-binding protein [Clostridiales bacterium]|jgi:Mrp family chromosome partitioning ATPase|nr:Mrp/NBP35 family ATP-binding protein [Clostridiales bacterium]MCI2160680.1 Mrp/NBP35 family ATP-binding protein [Oscillospiraceae bacterium]CAB1244064.1 Iron-sulfur cluster carrier protein [Ruminococcaceae bacterium BL-4]MCI1962176.1 Mrp/NBP35 family ATP-binding protein [Clostridiales bacterium]MCI2022618.1 Mrp/NBP35 family ATP-binding protein [Clostridiales bacterium]